MKDDRFDGYRWLERYIFLKGISGWIMHAGSTRHTILIDRIYLHAWERKMCKGQSTLNPEIAKTCHKNATVDLYLENRHVVLFVYLEPACRTKLGLWARSLNPNRSKWSCVVTESRLERQRCLRNAVIYRCCSFSSRCKWYKQYYMLLLSIDVICGQK